MSKKIICMTGAARSGKDTCAELIMSHKPNTAHFAFATALKESAAAAFGLDYRHLYGSLKESLVEVDVEWNQRFHLRVANALRIILGRQATEHEVAKIMDLTQIHFHKHGHKSLGMLVRDIWSNRHRGKLLISSRKILQLWGTEIIREGLGNDTWIHIVIRAIRSEPCGTAIITDMRFDNEAVKIKAAFPDAKVFKVVRPGQKLISQHVSENGLSERYIDVDITNDSTLAALEIKCQEAVDKAFN